jgi:hypothetical protein
MKKTDTHAFVNQILVCVLVTICFGGSIGLGTVWLRHQISVTAKTNRDLEMRITAIERQLTETSILVEEEQNTELLRQRNTEWRLGLVPPNEKQVVHVPGDPLRGLAERSNSELFAVPATVAPIRFALGQ